MSSVTTVAGGGMFTVEDVTTRGLRRQSEVAKEIAARRGDAPESVPVPVSLTPESVKTFFAKKKEETADPHEKSVYDRTISWIDELFDTKKLLVAAGAKIMLYQKSEAKTEDI